MVEKHINLLKRQIDRLNSPDFDLEAWKGSTLVLLERIFGPQTQKISQIEQIRYDFGSWSLRDASASVSPLESCKRRAREILEMTIDELENLESSMEAPGPNGQIIKDALEEELKMSQFREVKNILNSTEPDESKKKKVIEKLKSYDKGLPERLLLAILLHPEAVKDL